MVKFFLNINSWLYLRVHKEQAIISETFKSPFTVNYRKIVIYLTVTGY